MTQRHEVSKYCWKNGADRLGLIQGCHKPLIKKNKTKKQPPPNICEVQSSKMQ